MSGFEYNARWACSQYGARRWEGGPGREAMPRDRRPAEDLSIEELEALLARRRLEARQVRLHEFRRTGRAVRLKEPAPVQPAASEPTAQPGPPADGPEGEEPRTRRIDFRSAVNQGLLAVEIAAAIGLVFVLVSGLMVLQNLNREAAQAMAGPTAEPTPLITAVVLPSGHTPPTSPGGAQPNEAEIPASLRPLVQSMASLAIPTPGPEQARTVFIPAIMGSAAPVVQGDGWEQLKRGVGQHIGSANPGEEGNLVLSAHNDIFGEIFRDLDQLNPGDEVVLATATQEFVYRVTGWQIVGPTEVEVIAPTARATLTLISCYPYMVDNQRIVVFAELADR